MDMESKIDFKSLTEEYQQNVERYFRGLLKRLKSADAYFNVNAFAINDKKITLAHNEILEELQKCADAMSVGKARKITDEIY